MVDASDQTAQVSRAVRFTKRSLRDFVVSFLVVEK